MVCRINLSGLVRFGPLPACFERARLLLRWRAVAVVRFGAGQEDQR